jgi:putative exporter of polyketide antibiotics
VYLGLMLVNVVVPTGLGSPRAYFNYDWVTLLVMVIVAVLGVIVFFAAHRGRQIGEHLIDREAPVAAAEPVPVPDAVVAESPENPGPEAS